MTILFQVAGATLVMERDFDFYLIEISLSNEKYLPPPSPLSRSDHKTQTGPY